MNGEKLVPSGWTPLPLDPYDVHWFPTDPVSGLPVPQLRHDFTTESLSLLTDTANGGLKRDLSLLTLMSDTDFDAQVAPYQFGGLTGFIGFESGQQLTSGRLAWRRATGAALPYLPVMTPKFGRSGRMFAEWARFATTARKQERSGHDGSGKQHALYHPDTVHRCESVPVLGGGGKFHAGSESGSA